MALGRAGKNYIKNGTWESYIW